MTIEESINGIEKRILPIYDNDADHEALVTAIDTMRKYQKIRGIISTYGNVGTSFMCIDKIREVLEDGNNN